MNKEIPKLEDIAIECWVTNSADIDEMFVKKENVIRFQGRHIDDQGVTWKYATPCVSPLEAIGDNKVSCSNDKEYITICDAFFGKRNHPKYASYPVYVYRPGSTGSALPDRDIIPFSDFIKLPNNPPIEAPKVETERLTAVELDNKVVKTSKTGRVEARVVSIQPAINCIFLAGTSDGWINADYVTHYKNDQGEWVDAVKDAT